VTEGRFIAYPICPRTCPGLPPLVAVADLPVAALDKFRGEKHDRRMNLSTIGASAFFRMLKRSVVMSSRAPPVRRRGMDRMSCRPGTSPTGLSRVNALLMSRRSGLSLPGPQA
jgi:hypothetical protein